MQRAYLGQLLGRHWSLKRFLRLEMDVGKWMMVENLTFWKNFDSISFFRLKVVPLQKSEL